MPHRLRWPRPGRRSAGYETQPASVSTPWSSTPIPRGPVVVTDNLRGEARRVIDELRSRTGVELTEDEVIDSPHLFIGSVNRLVEKSCSYARNSASPPSCSATSASWSRCWSDWPAPEQLAGSSHRCDRDLSSISALESGAGARSVRQSRPSRGQCQHGTRRAPVGSRCDDSADSSAGPAPGPLGVLVLRQDRGPGQTRAPGQPSRSDRLHPLRSLDQQMGLGDRGSDPAPGLPCASAIGSGRHARPWFNAAGSTAHSSAARCVGSEGTLPDRSVPLTMTGTGRPRGTSTGQHRTPQVCSGGCEVSRTDGAGSSAACLARARRTASSTMS